MLHIQYPLYRRCLRVLMAALLLFGPLVAAAERLTVVYNVANPPLKFQEEQGRAAGILMDLWRLWGEKEGVEVDFRALPWDDTLRVVREGEADIHAGLFFTAERDRYLDFTAPLLDIDYHFFTHKTILGVERPEDLLGLRIGVPKGYSEQFVRERLPEATVAVYPDFPSLYEAAGRGEVKAFISPLLNLRYHLHRKGLANPYRHDPRTPAYQRSYLGAVREGNRTLLERIDRGMARITAEERAAIEEKWLGTARTDTAEVLTIAASRRLAPSPCSTRRAIRPAWRWTCGGSGRRSGAGVSSSSSTTRSVPPRRCARGAPICMPAPSTRRAPSRDCTSPPPICGCLSTSTTAVRRTATPWNTMPRPGSG